MGKKNKKKFYKTMRTQADRVSVNSSISSEDVRDEPVEKESKNKTVDLNPTETHEVKKEIRKILITILVMVLAIVAIYYINTKTNIILQAGEWMVERLNLSI